MSGQKKDTDKAQPFSIEKSKGGRPRKFKTGNDLRKAFLEYCKYQIQNNRPITKTSFKAYAMINHGYFSDLDKNEFSEALKKIDQICKAYAEEELFVGKNVAGVIFHLTNNYSDDYKNAKYMKHSDADDKPLFNKITVNVIDPN